MVQGPFCAIHQPNLFPRIATVAKLYASDIWVALDDVQFARQDFQHRCRVARQDDPSSWQWLSLSTRRPHGRETLIADVCLADPHAEAKRIDRIVRHYYRRSPFWRDVREIIDSTLLVVTQTDRLADITEASARATLGLLGWTGKIVRSSDFVVRRERSQRLADLTTAVGAATYLCGRGGTHYLERGQFSGIGIEQISIAETSGVHWFGANEISALRPIALAGAGEIGGELRRFINEVLPR